jgi:hypothetical protein
MADTSAHTTAEGTPSGLRLVDTSPEGDRHADAPSPRRVRRVLRLASTEDDFDGPRRMVLVQG